MTGQHVNLATGEPILTGIAKEFARADHNVHVVLAETLALAVPLWIWDLRGLTDDQRAARARRCSAMVAERGDVLMFGSKSRGKAAEVFNALAEGIACAAYLPGGIDFAGRHWCADHQRLCIDELARGESDRDQTPQVPKQRAVEDAVLNTVAGGLL